MGYKLSTTVPRVTDLDIQAIRAYAGAAGSLISISPILTEAQALAHATEAVTKQVDTSQSACISGVESVRFDAEAQRWNITFRISE